MKPIWRIVSLSLMGITFVILLLAVMTTNWREDHEERNDVFITHGLWRICRDIRFHATVDHKCFSEYASNGPSWLHAVRGFMSMAVLTSFVGFVYAVYLIANLPIIKDINYPNQKVSLVLSGVLYVFAALCILIGSSIYTAASSINRALYFPEDLPPTWGNSWSEVSASHNTISPVLSEDTNMKIFYGYSFGLAWFSLFTTTASFIVNFIGSRC